MFSAPIEYGPARPVTRPPARIGIEAPLSDRPMVRLKNSFASGGEFCRPLAAALPPPSVAVPVLGSPNWKMPEFSRKNSRFSGKRMLNRVRFTCCSSASTCEKSVFTVASSVSPVVSPYFRSSPASASRSDGVMPTVLALADTNGLMRRFRPGFNWRRPSIDPASDTRSRL